MPTIHDIDPTAPKLPEDEERLDWLDVQHVLEGAEEMWGVVNDNDAETWFFTKAGQYVRVTGSEQDRFYVWPAELARDYLDGSLENEDFAKYFNSAPHVSP